LSPNDFTTSVTLILGSWTSVAIARP
jgi:hypothetical protein